MKSANASRAEFLAAREPTGPAPITVWQVLRGVGARRDPLARWTEAWRLHGPVARYRFGIFDTYLINSAEGVERVLQDNTANYSKQHPAYSMLRRLFGNGLLTSEGDFWLRQRRLAQPAFHRQRVAAMAAPMTRAALETAGQWEAIASSGEPVGMLREMSRITLRIVGEALLGADLAARAGIVGDAWDVLNEQLSERVGSLRLLPPVLPTAYDRAFRRARRALLDTVDEVIAERRAHGRESDDLLSMLMHARDADTGARMTDAQLRDEAVTMLLAGHETTAVALAWLWTRVDRHPAVAAALHAELDAVLGARPPTFADVERLAYTRGLVDETLRLHPPAYIINRHVVADDVVCGRRVHRGGAILISPPVLHRHPDYWERPDEFLPERFADAAAEARRPRFAYLPFSLGPRQCIGAAFARLEAVLIVATLAQRFTATAVEGYQPTPEYRVMCRPSGGVPMRLGRRAPGPGTVAPPA